MYLLNIYYKIEIICAETLFEEKKQNARHQLIVFKCTLFLKKWRYCECYLLKILFNRNINYKKIVLKLCQGYIKEKETLR